MEERCIIIHSQNDWKFLNSERVAVEFAKKERRHQYYENLTPLSLTKIRKGNLKLKPNLVIRYTIKTISQLSPR